MKQLFQSRMEVAMVVMGFGLPILLLVLYIWVGNGLAEQLQSAASAERGNATGKVEFNIKGAEQILGARGLLQ